MTQNTDIQELVNEITNFVNSYIPEESAFIEAMSREHRTLQQSFTRLVLKWLEYCASEDYRYDDRNAAVHTTAMALIESFKAKRGMVPSNYLPFI
jgi:hypothetical protein